MRQTPTLRTHILRERLARVKATLLASALRGLDARQALPLVQHLSERSRNASLCHNASDVKLRTAHLATVDRSKIVDYLLNEAHPDNGGKHSSSCHAASRSIIRSS